MDQHPSQFNTKIDWAPAVMFGMVLLFFAALGIFSSKSNSDTDQKILQAIEKAQNLWKQPVQWEDTMLAKLCVNKKEESNEGLCCK